MYILYKLILKILRMTKMTFILNDSTYLKMNYYILTYRKLNLNNPVTFNEKLQWLKIYDRNEIYTTMVDKYEVKDYVAKVIGSEYIIPTIGIYDKFDDIIFDNLPNQFVIKCTHDSGGLVICKDKKNFNIQNAKKIINKCLKKNYFYNGREWPYKNVKPRILIEKYMEDIYTKELIDYKFFCFNGIAKLMFVATDRSIHKTKFDFYDLKFNKLPIKQHYPNSDKKIEKPFNFDKMIILAEKLSKNIPHVRVDFYEINGKIFFGELTFYHFSGFVLFEPDEWDKRIGDMLDLSKVKRREK